MSKSNNLDLSYRNKIATNIDMNEFNRVEYNRNTLMTRLYDPTGENSFYSMLFNPTIESSSLEYFYCIQPY